MPKAGSQGGGRLRSPHCCRVTSLVSLALQRYETFDKRRVAVPTFAEIGISPYCFKFGKLEVMKTQFTFWKERDGRYLGYLNAYPDHWTQGESLEDLKEQFQDLYHTFSSEEIPGIRRVEELEVA